MMGHMLHGQEPYFIKSFKKKVGLIVNLDKYGSHQLSAEVANKNVFHAEVV